jgi:methylated-DNA-protein-cysteine methyltransferase-like protein
MEFEERIQERIRAIPRGKVATYGQIAALAGNPRGARQVARVLHSCSAAARLPWHRVINGRGGISLRRGKGFEEQRRRLLGEGVRVGPGGRIGLEKFQWLAGACPTKGAREFLKALKSSDRPRRAGARRRTP